MLSLLELNSFRSHKNNKWYFKSNQIIFLGPNASGKTNILESIYVGLLLKPFKASQKHLIPWGENYYKINLIFNNPKLQIEHRYEIKNNFPIKKIKINQVERKPSEIIGIQPIVLFKPDDIAIINGLPDSRRNFINTLLSQINSKYLHKIIQYRKIIKQKNSLLFKIKNLGYKKDQLFVYNLQLVDLIYDIQNFRRQTINDLIQPTTEIYSRISNKPHKINIEYISSTPLKKDFILSELEKTQDLDIRLGYSSKGPHRDNIIIKLNNINVSEGLSRGENRSLALALKLAELNYIKQQTNKNPILLLDDVFSELDEIRQQNLLNITSDSQVFITATHLPKKTSNFQIINLK